MVSPQRIDRVGVEAAESVAPGERLECVVSVLDPDGKPVEAVVPLEVTIRDADGRPAEFSGYYAAVGGKLALPLGHREERSARRVGDSRPRAGLRPRGHGVLPRRRLRNHGRPPAGRSTKMPPIRCSRRGDDQGASLTMDRRTLLFKAGITTTDHGSPRVSSAGLATTVGGTIVSTLSGAESPPARVSGGAPAVLGEYTAADHRRRLENIGLATRGIRKCMRKHLVTDYLPGQCCYNLGEYPCRKPWDPDDYDEQELDRLKEHGIQLVQVFDEWNDSLRLFGGDKYTALNPAGFRRFVDMAHRRGIKVLAYSSTGFLQWTDPDFRQEWSPKDSRCSLGFWDMAGARRQAPAGGRTCCRG